MNYRTPIVTLRVPLLRNPILIIKAPQLGFWTELQALLEPQYPRRYDGRQQSDLAP